MPASVLERDRENVHQAVIQSLTTGSRTVFLRVSRAAADDAVRVVTGVDDDAFDAAEVEDATSQPESQIDPRLRLDLGGVRLRVGLHDRPLGLPFTRKRDDVFGIRAVQHPGDDAVIAFVDGGG